MDNATANKMRECKHVRVLWQQSKVHVLSVACAVMMLREIIPKGIEQRYLALK